MSKTVDAKNAKDAAKKIGDLKIFGNSNMWKLLCKASSKKEGWMKSTKGLNIPGAGVVIQVSTQQGDHIAEALTFLPEVSLVPDNETQDRFVLVGGYAEPGWEPFVAPPLPHSSVRPPEPLPDVLQKFFEALLRRTEREEERAESRRKSIDHDERREKRKEARRDFWHFTEVADLYERQAKMLAMSKEHFTSSIDGKEDLIGIAAFNSAEYLQKAIEEVELIHAKKMDDSDV